MRRRRSNEKVEVRRNGIGERGREGVRKGRSKGGGEGEKGERK